MALRALVFSSDGSTTSALCHVLTDLGIEAEICSEMLVAVERITSQPYDALLVDWDQQAEAIFLVKQLRELKLAAQALTLALVQNDEDLPQALQAGANSVIRKPIDSKQAQDTLSTAKQLILGRQAEHRKKESRLAAEQAAPLAPVEGNFAVDDPENANQHSEQDQPKKGFLEQTATRSAVEAEQSVASAEPPPAPPTTPSASDPSVRDRALSILGYASKAESDESPQAPSQESQNPRSADPVAPSSETSHTNEQRSEDTTHEFSSLPDNFGHTDEEEQPAGQHYGLYAFAAALLIAGVLWVFAPGDSYIARLKNLHSWPSRVSQPTVTPTPKVESRFAHPTAPKAEEPVLPDPALTDAQDEASSNIQVIENKPIPVAGAQQPPTSDASPDAQPVTTAETPGVSDVASAPAVPAPASDNPAAPSHPQLQATAETQLSSAPVHPTVIPLPPVVRAPDNASGDPVSPRTGVIIPDSLKNSPSASPASSLEPPIVPEETSRALIVKRVDPGYPPMAIPQHLEGIVVLQAYVGQDGSIRDLKLVRGYFLLGRAAFDAVRQWRFKPYTQNGKIIDFQTYITINFKLPN